METMLYKCKNCVSPCYFEVKTKGDTFSGLLIDKDGEKKTPHCVFSGRPLVKDVFFVSSTIKDYKEEPME